MKIRLINEDVLCCRDGFMVYMSSPLTGEIGHLSFLGYYLILVSLYLKNCLHIYMTYIGYILFVLCLWLFCCAIYINLRSVCETQLFSVPSRLTMASEIPNEGS